MRLREIIGERIRTQEERVEETMQEILKRQESDRYRGQKKEDRGREREIEK